MVISILKLCRIFFDEIMKLPPSSSNQKLPFQAIPVINNSSISLTGGPEDIKKNS